MIAMTSAGVVRRIIEDEGAILVSFDEHAGYFRLKDASQRGVFERAKLDSRQVTFSHDEQLNILSVSSSISVGGPKRP